MVSMFHRPLDLGRGHVELMHGAGGRASQQLIADIFLHHFAPTQSAQIGNDGAVLTLPEAFSTGRLVFSCDGHVVAPVFFPGGDIGCLAVHGTVNDVAMMGATPLWLSASVILEEGFPLADLARIAASMAQAAKAAGVSVVTGDTKVVERGKADGIFITTSGIGWLANGPAPAGERAQAGDVILLSGTLGEHGMAIFSQREHFALTSPIVSDTAALNGLVATLRATTADIHVLRDPTRGGLAATLNEIAQQARVGMIIEETALPVCEAVRAACELLGLDPLNLANEGKLVAIVAPEDEARVLAAMHAHPLGRAARTIGRVVADTDCFVEMHTTLGGMRMIDWLSGDPLPRIC